MDIVNKQYGNVIFYNDSLQPDPSIRPEKETFFVCEYGKTRDESADEYYRSDYVVKKGEEGTEHSTRYYGGGNLGVTAFVIMDSTFTQLRDPFPYYVKFSFGKNDKARVNAKVLKLSQKLTMYSGKS